MTIELSYKKGEYLGLNQVSNDIQEKLPELTHKDPNSGWNVAKDDIDIKVTITINHESINQL